ncbi:MAG: hypothetical protein ABI609_12455 [Acidobacteriota bacterium]
MKQRKVGVQVGGLFAAAALASAVLAGAQAAPASAANATAAPANLCMSDLHRLLRVTASREFVHHSIRLPPPPLLVVEDYTVAVGGAVVGTSVTDEICDLCTTHHRTVFAGKGTPAALGTLKQSLADDRVDKLQSCLMANVLEGLSEDTFGTFELTWYGANGRIRQIQVLYADPSDNEPLPRCGPAVGRILDALDAYLTKLSPVGGSCSS